MLFIRSLLFTIFLALWTMLIATFGLPLLLTPPRVAGLVGRYWAYGVVWGLRVLCNITYEIRGLENLPQGNYIIAAKHQSAWDTAIFLKTLDFPAYVLKKELLKIPFYGWYLPAMGMIPIDRNAGASALKDMIKLSKNRLENGQNVVIFPEGTRIAPGMDMGEYQPGISALYNQCNVPVIPVGLNSGLFWWKKSFLKPSGHIIMEYLPPIAPGTLKRKEFMKTLHQQIETTSRRLEEEAKE